MSTIPKRPTISGPFFTKALIGSMILGYAFLVSIQVWQLLTY